MTELALTVACTSSDRTRPVLDERVKIEGVDAQFTTGEPEDLFRQAVREQTFDVTELSMGSHMVTTARGDSHYIGIPVFPSRAFRHSGVFIRSGAGIERPEDLAGRRIGLPEYQQTAALWVRGILSDQYGVKPEDVEWVIGSQEEAGGTERTAITLPDRIRLKRIATDETLSGLLASGNIDAIITPRPPSGYLRGDGSVKRLFPDFKAAEIAYHRATGFFPIMHCIALRRSLADAHPWLPKALFDAFSAAKQSAMDDLQKINFLRISMPWVAAHFEETSRLLGDDYWAYGSRRNEKEVEAMLRYAREDGLITNAIAPSDLFHSSLLDT